MNLKRMTEVIKSKKDQDTTKMYDREEFIQRINDITSGKIKLKNEAPAAVKNVKGTKTYKVKDRNGNEIEMSKDEFESFLKRRGVKIN